jgi:hypothetical protein
MTSHDRVRSRTSPSANREIRAAAEARIDEARSESADGIRARLEEIDREWDIERALETLSSGLSLVGLAMASRRPRWLLVPAAVQGFLLQHALQGWCPPLPLLRRIGFRTQQEIERERYTLRALLRDRVGRADVDRPAELPALESDRERPLRRSQVVAEENPGQRRDSPD